MNLSLGIYINCHVETFSCGKTGRARASPRGRDRAVHLNRGSGQPEKDRHERSVRKRVQGRTPTFAARSRVCHCHCHEPSEPVEPAEPLVKPNQKILVRIYDGPEVCSPHGSTVVVLDENGCLDMASLSKDRGVNLKPCELGYPYTRETFSAEYIRLCSWSAQNETDIPDVSLGIYLEENADPTNPGCKVAYGFPTARKIRVRWYSSPTKGDPGPFEEFSVNLNSCTLGFYVGQFARDRGVKTAYVFDVRYLKRFATARTLYLCETELPRVIDPSGFLALTTTEGARDMPVKPLRTGLRYYADILRMWRLKPSEVEIDSKHRIASIFTVPDPSVPLIVKHEEHLSSG